MADPLSISMGAAGLVSLAISICQSLVTYYASWKDCDRDIAHLYRLLEIVSKNMVHLQSCLSRYDFPATLKRQAEVAILACNDEIKSLEIEANLVSTVGPTEIRRTRMRTFVRNATYPFKESTLQKLKNSLAEIQSTVGSAVSILGLDTLGALTSTSTSIAAEVTDAKRSIIKISNEMPLIRTTIERCEQDLPAISAKISLMNSDIQDIKESLYQVRCENRLDHRHISRELFNALPSTRASSMMIEFGHNNSRQYQIQSNGSKAVEFVDKTDILDRQLDQLQLRCISRPSLMRTELDSVEDDIYLYLSDHSNLSHHSTRMKHPKYSSLPMKGCSCRPVLSSNASWPISRNFQISTVSIKSHRKGCPLSKNAENQNQKLRLKTIFAARFLMRALEISLGLTRGAGGYSIASSIKMRTLFRGDSPAFQLFNTKPVDLISSGRLEVPEVIDYMTDALAKIEILFRDGKASPSDINVEAKTILQSASDWADYLPLRIRGLQVQSARKELLLGLAHLGVPLDQKDFYNDDIFSTVLRKERIHQQFDPQWHIYSSLCAIEPVSKPGSWFSPFDLFVVARELEEYADFYECGILSTALLAKNQEAVERILLERPQAIYERNTIGQTPMHLAADWIWGITRLISARAPCDIRDENGVYSLNYAFGVMNWTTYELILASDTPILTLPFSRQPYNSLWLSEFCPKKLPPQTFGKICTAIATRRKRLANFAFHILTPMEYEDLVLYRAGVLDSKAREVYDILVSRGHEVPSALGVPFRGFTVYHTPWLTTAEMTQLYDTGFRDIDSFDCMVRTPLMIAALQVEIRGTFAPLEWLVSRGASPLREVTTFGTTQLHYIANAMASYFVSSLKPLKMGQPRLSRESMLNVKHGVNFIMRQRGRDLKDSCQCGCSINGCSPLNLFLKCVIRHIHSGATCRCQAVWIKMRPTSEECKEELYKALYHFVEQIIGIFYKNENVAVSAYREIIRLFVFEVLGLTHTCCKTHTRTPSIIQLKIPEEIQEIRDEEWDILLELDSLCEEGIVRRSNYDGPFRDFLAEFLSEIRDRPQVSLDREQARKIEEIGVVLEANCKE